MPALSGDFLAMSVFFYATDCLRKLGPAALPAWPRPTLAELREAAGDFCAMGWTAVQERKVRKVQRFVSSSVVGFVSARASAVPPR